ncbi:MAG: ABC transporter permease, partial [Peptostreptococcaceae bacterium]
MNEIIKFELKKICDIKNIIIISIMSMVLSASIFFARAYSMNTFNRLDNIKQSCEVLVGEITEEKVNPIQALHEEIVKNKKNYIVVNDEVEMKADVRKKFNLLENALAFNNLNELQKDKIKELEKELSNTLDSSERLLIQKNIDMLKEKGNMIIGYNLFYDFTNFFVSNLAPIILGFLIILSLAPVFSREYGTNMDALILSSKKGKKDVIFAKFIASFMMVTFIFVIVLGSYYLVSALVLGINGGETSLTSMIYNPFIYIDSPYNFNMREYLIISTLVSYIGCLCLGGLTILVSSKVKNQLLVVMIVMSIFYVPFLL